MHLNVCAKIYVMFFKNDCLQSQENTHDRNVKKKENQIY